MRVGEKVYLVRNTRGWYNAAYNRVKKGEFPAYQIIWKSFLGDHVDARMVLPSGHMHSHIYNFRFDDIMPARFMDKKLEDYL